MKIQEGGVRGRRGLAADGANARRRRGPRRGRADRRPVANGVQNAVVAHVAVRARRDHRARRAQVRRDHPHVHALHWPMIPAHGHGVDGRVHELRDQHAEVARQVHLVVAHRARVIDLEQDVHLVHRVVLHGEDHRGREARRRRRHGAIETPHRGRAQRAHRRDHTHRLSEPLARIDHGPLLLVVGRDRPAPRRYRHPRGPAIPFHDLR